MTLTYRRSLEFGLVDLRHQCAPVRYLGTCPWSWKHNAVPIRVRAARFVELRLTLLINRTLLLRNLSSLGESRYPIIYSDFGNYFYLTGSADKEEDKSIHLDCSIKSRSRRKTLCPLPDAQMLVWKLCFALLSLLAVFTVQWKCQQTAQVLESTLCSLTDLRVRASPQHALRSPAHVQRWTVTARLHHPRGESLSQALR